MLMSLKEYRLITDTSQEIVVCGEKLSDAVLAVESPTVNINQATILRNSVQVDVPDATVRFNVSITPEAAETAGAVALPKTFLADVGQEVIFQAVGVDGYTFSGWYRGLTLLSADAVASIAIAAPAAGTSADEIEARFALS